MNAALAVVAVVVLVPLAHAALWFVLDGSEADRIRRLFEPQWKREADFLARSIPTADRWGSA